MAIGPLASLKVLFSGGGVPDVSHCSIRSRVWRIGGSNLHFTIPNDGTAGLWTPPRAAGDAILNGLEVP